MFSRKVGTVDVCLDSLSDEELGRLDKTESLLSRLSWSFNIPIESSGIGAMSGLVLSLLFLFGCFIYLVNNPEPKPEASQFSLWSNILFFGLTFCLPMSITGPVGHWIGKSKMKKEQDRLVAELTAIAAESTLCCRIIKFSFLQRKDMRALQSPQLTELFAQCNLVLPLP